MHREVAAQRGRVLGPDHPDTLASHYEIGLTLSRTGRAEEALREFTRVAEGRERALGADHSPDARRPPGDRPRPGPARPARRGPPAVRDGPRRPRTRHGPDHPDTLRCRHNLAFTLCRLGRPEESWRLAREVADARARVLGATHPDTLATRYEVAYTLGRLDRWAEALATYQDVARARTDVLGADHPDTFAARYEAGISLGRLGRDTEALELYRSLVADRTRTAGAADPETLRARHGLGVNLGRLGRWEEALAEARDVCALRERALGPITPTRSSAAGRSPPARLARPVERGPRGVPPGRRGAHPDPGPRPSPDARGPRRRGALPGTARPGLRLKRPSCRRLWWGRRAEGSAGGVPSIAAGSAPPDTASHAWPRDDTCGGVVCSLPLSTVPRRGRADGPRPPSRRVGRPGRPSPVSLRAGREDDEVMDASLSGVSAPARLAADGEAVSHEELALATRNHGLPLEALRYDVTPRGCTTYSSITTSPPSTPMPGGSGSTGWFATPCPSTWPRSAPSPR